MPYNNKTQDKKIGAAIVVGSGIGGMQAALDLAESGIKVYLVDNKASIGGVMSQLDKTFPTNDCAMCTMAPRLVETGRNKDIEIITFSEVESIKGQPGNFSVTLKKKPRFVDETKCTGCGACVSNCPTRNTVQLIEREKVDLEPQYKEKVTEILEKHKSREGPLMPILQEISARFSYFPGGVLEYVSQEMGYPMTHIYRLATFYNAFSFTPQAKHTINVCMGTACYIKGGGRILEGFEKKLGIKEGEVTSDLKFGIGRMYCVGCCGQAPVAVVNQDLHGYFNASHVPALLKSYDGAK
jgi:NADH:ubiquinone oxidoreductase subunit E